MWTAKLPGGLAARWALDRQVEVTRMIYRFIKKGRQVGFTPGGPGGFPDRWARWLPPGGRQVASKWPVNTFYLWGPNLERKKNRLHTLSVS